MLISNVAVLQGAGSFFRGVLASMEGVYLSRNPTAKSVLELVGSEEQISYDHFAFRTFAVLGFLYVNSFRSCLLALAFKFACLCQLEL